MSKKKSLGSSPIGYSSLGMESFEFIPTIQEPVSASYPRQHYAEDTDTDIEHDYTNGMESVRLKENNEPIEKRIVSYYLEEHLVERIKKIADARNMYYSSLVNRAIFFWLENNGYGE